MCFGLQGDLAEKKGQIAHIDRDPSNSTPENLVYLCMEHHDQYDSRTSQSKGMTPNELRFYRDELYKTLDTNPPPWPDTRANAAKTHSKKGRATGIARGSRSFELYDRRIEIYRAAKDLLGRIVSSSSVEMADAAAFARATDEALFLFDDDIAAYLADIYRRAMKLAALTHVLEGLPAGERRTQVVNEQMEIVLWFDNQFEVLRNKLKPFLRGS